MLSSDVCERGDGPAVGGRSLEAAMRGRTLLLVGLLACASRAHAQSETEVASLSGIGKLEIVVAPLGDAAAALGVPPQLLETRIDTRLREADVPVAGFAVAFLQLDVSAIPLEAGPDVVIHTALSFFQPAASTLNQWIGPARTWSLTRITVTGSSRAREMLLTDVEHLTDAFVASWTAANPRPQ